MFIVKISLHFTNPLIDVGIKSRNSSPSNPLLHVTTVQPKIYRPKAKNKYTPIIYDDADDDLYFLKAHGTAMTRSSQWNHRPRNDLFL